MPLHIDYRPVNLKEVVGQAGAVSALQAKMKEGDFPHTVLFTGPAGTGKTTLARIVAGWLGVSGPGLHELNAATFRGIETAREIQKLARYKPGSGTCRVFFLDEAHKLTPDAQEALLKPLEHPPAHVYFILATTEPNKLIRTVRSRCMTFDLKPVNEKTLVKLMESVAKEEGCDMPAEVLQRIAQNAVGSPRNALVLLDKVLDLHPDDMLDAVETEAGKEIEAIELARALIKGAKWPTIAKMLREMDGEPESVRRMLLSYASSVLLKKDDPRAYLILDAFREPIFDLGRAGLIAGCYEVING